MGKHTKAPWLIEKTELPNDTRFSLTTEDGSVLAEFFGDDNDSNCWPVTANIQLASAAPDLLAACKSALLPLKAAWQAQTDGADLWPVFEEMRIAIARAEGKAVQS